MSGLAGKVVIVTGAAHGLGRATVRLLAEAGAVVVATDADAAVLAGESGAAPGGTGPGGASVTPRKTGSATTVVADVTSEADMTALVDGAVQQFGRVDGLVHYAGITRDAMHWNMSLGDFEQVLRVNLTGSFVAARTVAGVMRQQGYGSIVLTASRVYLGNVGQANYAASKGAVVSLMRTLALELGRSGVRVNALAPGFIATRMTSTVPAKLRERALATTPLGRVGEPEEVARAARFLVSDEASFITGQVLFVDGGRSVGAAPA